MRYSSSVTYMFSVEKQDRDRKPGSYMQDGFVVGVSCWWSSAVVSCEEVEEPTACCRK